MTSPAAAAPTASSFASATSHLVTQPPTVNAGDLLVMGCSASGLRTFTTPSGWSIQCARTALTNAAAIVYVINAAGTEGGTTVGVTTDVATEMTAQVFRVTGWGGTLGTDVVSGAPATGATSTAPDPPSASWTWGSLDALALVFAGGISATTQTVINYPSSYTGGTLNTRANSVFMASAQRSLTAAASPENPATYTVGVTTNWIANTVVIKPVTSAALSRNPTSSIANTAAVGRVSGEQRNPTSSIANTATLSRISGMLRTRSSSIAHTAVLARILGAVRSPASSIAHTAAVARAVAVARTVTSSIAHTAAVTYLIVGHTPIRTMTSSITHTAAVSRATTAVRTVTSSIAHTAVLSRLMASIRGATSSITHSATLAWVKAALRTLTSSIAQTAVLGRFGPNVRTLVSAITHVAVLTYQWVSGNPKTPTYIDLEARDAPLIDLDAYDRATIDLEARDYAFIDLEARDA